MFRTFYSKKGVKIKEYIIIKLLLILHLYSVFRSFLLVDRKINQKYYYIYDNITFFALAYIDVEILRRNRHRIQKHRRVFLLMISTKYSLMANIVHIVSNTMQTHK